MFEDKLHVLPAILVAYVPTTFIITYSIAVGSGHVAPGFPYISDTGTFPPESCVFGQLLNMGAALAVYVVYLRYKQVDTHYRDTDRISLRRVNLATFILGLITALGVSIVGNFQETSVIAVHLLGAFMAFAIGGIYCYFQTGISFAMKTDLPGSSTYTTKIRLSFCIAHFVLLIALGIASMAAGSNENRFKWSSSDPGYAQHLVATISEWLIAIVTCAFFGTFCSEFKRFRRTSSELVFDYDMKTSVTISENTVSSIVDNGSTCSNIPA